METPWYEQLSGFGKTTLLGNTNAKIRSLLKKKSKKELGEIRSKAARKEINDLDGLLAKITKPMKKTEIYELAEKDGHGTAHLLRRDWKIVEERLLKTPDGLFLTKTPKKH